MEIIRNSTPPTLSGQRFAVLYGISGAERAAHARAEDICVEQTIEFPLDLIPSGPIRDQIVGRLESFGPAGEGVWWARISYAAEVAGGELTQLLNVIFGNISLKPGVRVEQLFLDEDLCRTFRGPRFGRQGMRDRLQVHGRPIVSTALKPMGLPPEALAEMAYRLALGGIDLIKDDHGLANQPFATFEARVGLCSQAIARANRETGGNCQYAANVTAGPEDLGRRARFAKSTGCGALVMAPGLTGLDAMRALADDDAIALPILSHPAFLGAFVTHRDSGMSPFALFGQVARLAGADASIFPSSGGRFAFTPEECAQLAAGTAVPMGPLRPIFPASGGGMSLSSLPSLAGIYGKDFIVLIGGALFRQGPGLTAACRAFRQLAERV